jgi:hypothetical protein
VRKHIERHGIDKVETFIDVCLSLENLIDPMSQFIVRRAQTSPRPGEAEKEEVAEEVPKLRAKQYMDGYINPAAFVDRQRKLMQQQKERVKKFPEETPARRAAVPDRERPIGEMGARHPGDHQDGVVLLRPAGPDQDTQRRLGMCGPVDLGVHGAGPHSDGRCRRVHAGGVRR